MTGIPSTPWNPHQPRLGLRSPSSNANTVFISANCRYCGFWYPLGVQKSSDHALLVVLRIYNKIRRTSSHTFRTISSELKAENRRRTCLSESHAAPLQALFCLSCDIRLDVGTAPGDSVTWMSKPASMAL